MSQKRRTFRPSLIDAPLEDRLALSQGLSGFTAMPLAHVLHQDHTHNHGSGSGQTHHALQQTFTGTYTTFRTVPDAGTAISLNGSGSMHHLGQGQISGLVNVPGLVASGQATGQVTFTNTRGSVTLQVSGPVQGNSGSVPGQFSYQVASGTGAYANATGSGTLGLTVTPSSTGGATGAGSGGSFTLNLTSGQVVVPHTSGAIR